MKHFWIYRHTTFLLEIFILTGPLVHPSTFPNSRHTHLLHAITIMQICGFKAQVKDFRCSIFVMEVVLFERD